MVTLPALPVLVLSAEMVAPSVMATRWAVSTMSPPGPAPAVPVNNLVFCPVRVTGAVAVTVTMPPGPNPVVLLLIRAPPVSVN